jgi:hypothetical protein
MSERYAFWETIRASSFQIGELQTANRSDMFLMGHANQTPDGLRRAASIRNPQRSTSRRASLPSTLSIGRNTSRNRPRGFVELKTTIRTTRPGVDAAERNEPTGLFRLTRRRIALDADEKRTSEGTVFVRMNERPVECFREHCEF